MTQDDKETITKPVQDHNKSTSIYHVKPILLIVSMIAASLIFAIVYTNAHVKQMFMQHSQAAEQQHLALQQSAQQALQQFQETTQARIQSINETFNQALKNQPSQPAHWVLLKARYYLELASINNIWTNDNQTTLALLQEADQLLATVQKENIAPVRQAIADERAALLAIPSLDVAGILSTLNTLQHMVNTMQPTLESPTSKSPKPLTKPFIQLTWREHLQHALQTLRSLVVIHHLDDDDTFAASMTPSYVAMQRSAIRLNLAAAETAVIQRQTTLYQVMIQQVRDNLAHVFDLNHPQTKAMMHLLDTLQAIQLTNTKPSLDLSIQQLNQVIEAELVETTTEKAT